MTTLSGTNSQKGAQGGIPGMLIIYLFVFFKSGYKVVCENSLHFTLMACALPVCDFIFQSEALKELVLFFLIELRNPKSSFGYRSKIWKCTMQEGSCPVTHCKLALGLKNNCQASREHL